MSKSSQAQALPGSRAFEDQPIGTECRPCVADQAVPGDSGLALLSKIASQLALLNLMGGTTSHARRAPPSQRIRFNRAIAMPGSRPVRRFR